VRAAVGIADRIEKARPFGLKHLRPIAGRVGQSLPARARAAPAGAGYLRDVRLLCTLAVTMSLATSARAERRKNPLAPDVGKSCCYSGRCCPQITALRRAGAVALAVGPGFFVHGIGSWTVGEKRTAKKLLYGEVIGLGIATGAGLLVGGSGGNPYTIVPGVPLVIAGGGMFFQSWLADIWVAAGGDIIVERPRAQAPWSVELGTSWLHDAYRERALLRAGATAWLASVTDGPLARVGVSANGLFDAAGDAKLADGSIHARLLGPTATGEEIGGGSRITVRAGTRIHVDDGDGTSQWTQELEVSGRLDLERIDANFRSSFVELGTGIGLVRVKYGELAREWSSALLGHFAWGAYLGARGEAKLFYEHSREGLVGGLPAWRAAGFVGYVGAAADVRVYGPWALRGELAIGNAYLTTLAIAYRGGPR
jgi:hypothetical protein